MIPTDWQESTIGELGIFSNGHGFRPPDWSDKGWPIIRIQNLNGSKDFNYYNQEPEKQWIVEPGTLLFAWAGVKGVSFGPKIWDGPAGVLNQHIYKITPKHGVDLYWLYSLLEIVTSRIEKNAHGFKTNLLHVRKSDITDQVVHVPPLPEQHKIAEILSTWDEAIDLTEQLIAAKQRRKQALMQRLLTGQVRFPGFCDEALSIGRFDDFIVLQRGFDLPILEREAGAIKVIASNGQVGFHRVSKVKGPGVITGRSGTIGNVHYEENDFWPLNTTLYVKDFKGNHPLFVFYFLQQFHLERFGTGSGVPTLNRNDVHQTIIQFPILNEQIRIAQFLHVIDEELALHHQKLAALLRQKGGLMQQLLTGRVRVVG